MILKNDKQFKKWLNTIYSYGFAIVENAPIESNSAFNILNKIGYHRETFFGTPFDPPLAGIIARVLSVI